MKKELRPLFCLLCLVLVACWTAAATARAALGAGLQARPNVLLIITDQQHANMLSCAGNHYVKTPNLDRLAAGGMRFARTYAANPVCVPSRFSLMTGHLPSVIGMENNDDDRNPVSAEIRSHALGRIFQQAGYQTVYAGKVHLPGQEGVRGNVSAYGFEHRLAPKDPEGRDATVQACVQFLRQPHERPFLLVASLINPHDICYMGIRDYYQHGGQKKWPLSRLAIQELDKALSRPPGVSEAEFFDKYCPPLPPNYEVPCEELSASLPDKAADGYFIIWSRQNWDDRQWRLHRWAYARLTEFVDRQIGQILDALRDAGLEDKTVVAMTSDHGDQDASHRLEHKGFLYEESPHIPLILRYRGVVKAGQVDQEHLVSNGTDLLPTLCDLAGLPVSATYPGRSIRPLSEGRDVADWRKSLIVETRFARLVHMGRWKYMVGIDPQQTPEKYKPFFPQTNVREVLVDLEKDPGEMNNRASEPACAAILRRGRQWLQEGYAAMRRNAEEKYMVKE